MFGSAVVNEQLDDSILQQPSELNYKQLSFDNKLILFHLVKYFIA